MKAHVLFSLACLTLFACPADPPTPPSLRDDFPDPIVEPGLPEGIAGIFAGEAQGGGPCLLAPELGALFPRNFSAPRFVITPPQNHNVFAFEIQIPGEASPYLLITPRVDFLLDEADWELIKSVAPGKELQIKVLSAQVDLATLTVIDGPRIGSEGQVTLGEVAAEGSILYWTVDGDLDTGITSFFAIRAGSNTATNLYNSDENGGQCIGCHASSPDGQFVALTVGNPGPPDFSMDIVRIGDLSFSPFPGLGAEAQAELDHREATIPSFSAAHYNDIEKRIIYVKDRALASLDLLSGLGGPIATADPRAQAMPTWSPDGETIVYVSTEGELDGRTTEAPCDLFEVPYNDGQGGTATPVPLAASPARQEFYPAFSPDGALLAFNTAPQNADTFNAPDAEIHVLRGDQDLRLRANDPPSCSPRLSPGVTNSWPKWAPFTVSFEGSTFYFLTFSSTRLDGVIPQIFVAPLEITPEGDLREFPALLLPGQDPSVGNHTPAWNPLPIE